MKKLALAISVVFVPVTVTANPVSTPQSTSVTSAMPGNAAPAGELLDPDHAFQPRVRFKDAKTAEVKFDIVPGYYLYRSRIRVEGFAPVAPTAFRDSKNRAAHERPAVVGSVMTTRLSLGRFVDDPTFGRVEIFDKPMSFEVDLALQPASGAKSAASGAGKIATKLVVTSQGCAAAGVCFPPQQHEFALPATVSPTRGSAPAENPWVLPLGGSTSLGFGRSKPPATSSFGR